MGAGGIALAFVLLVILAVLLLLLLLSIVFLTTSWNQRRRGVEPSPWLNRVGIGLLAIVIAVPTLAISWAKLNADPEVLHLDLRSPVPEEDLPGEDEPGFRGFYDIDSDRVDLRLPEGRRLRTEVSATVVTVKDERVTSVSIHRIAMDPDDADAVVRTWAKALRLRTPGLDAALDDTARSWDAESSLGSVQTKLALQPVADGEKMIPRLRLEP